MENSIKLSMIVTLYNGEKYIERCLKSIENSVKESNDEIEVVIINDGSKDNSKTIVENFKENSFLDINLINVENGGVARARNLGISTARGEYVWFIDCDDTIFDDAIEKIFKNFDLDRDVYIYKYNMVTSNGDYIKTSKTFDFVEDICLYKEIYDNIKPSDFKKVLFFEPGPVLYVVKKKLYIDNNIKYPLGKIYEDLGTTPRLLALANSVKYTTEIVYNYYQTDASIMRGTNINRRGDVIGILKNLKEQFSKDNILDTYKEELEYISIKHSHYIYESIFLVDSNSGVLQEISSFLNKEWPRWVENKYFKKENLKTRIFYKLELNNKNKILKLIKNIKKIAR